MQLDLQKAMHLNELNLNADEIELVETNSLNQVTDQIMNSKVT